jgi:hypothetical protein
VIFSSSRAGAVTTLCPDCPEQDLVSHGTAGQGRPSSLWERVVEKSHGLFVGYLLRALEQYERVGAKKISSGLAVEEPVLLGQQRDHCSQGQGDQEEAGG